MRAHSGFWVLTEFTETFPGLPATPKGQTLVLKPGGASTAWSGVLVDDPISRTLGHPASAVPTLGLKWNEVATLTLG